MCNLQNHRREKKKYDNRSNLRLLKSWNTRFGSIPNYFCGSTKFYGKEKGKKWSNNTNEQMIPDNNGNVATKREVFQKNQISRNKCHFIL